MSYITDMSLFVFIVANIAFGWWIGFKFLNPEAKAREYINWFKIGRIKQFAKEKDIDIDKLIVEDEQKNMKRARLIRKLEDTWTRKIELKLAEELEPIEKELKDLKKDKDKEKK